MRREVLYMQGAIAYGATLRDHRSVCHDWGCDLLLLLIPKLGKVIKIFQQRKSALRNFYEVKCILTNTCRRFVIQLQVSTPKRITIFCKGGISLT